MADHFNEGFLYNKMYSCFAGWPKKVALITRSLYYPGGRKAEFHCIFIRNGGI